MQFRFVDPTDIGGLPIESYAAEYRQNRQHWREARRRVWPANENGVYILEDLNPQTTYDLRFACKNRVGFSNWGVDQQVTTPRKGKPEPPILNERTSAGEIKLGDVIELPTPDHYEVSWKIPEDNGVAIDYFLLTYYPVTKDSTRYGRSWKQIGDITNLEIPHNGKVRWNMQLPYQNTYYKVEMKAHNKLGFSPESVIIVKSGKDPRPGGGPKILPPEYTTSCSGTSSLSHTALLISSLLLSVQSALSILSHLLRFSPSKPNLWLIDVPPSFYRHGRYHHMRGCNYPSC
jgi:neurocan core protein